MAEKIRSCLLPETAFLTQPELIVHVRNLHIHEPFPEQPLFEILLHFVFAVNEEEFFNGLRILAGEPLTHIFIVAVRAHTPDHTHFGMHFMLDAENTYFPVPGQQPAAQ